MEASIGGGSEIREEIDEDFGDEIPGEDAVLVSVGSSPEGSVEQLVAEGVERFL